MQKKAIEYFSNHGCIVQYETFPDMESAAGSLPNRWWKNIEHSLGVPKLFGQDATWSAASLIVMPQEHHAVDWERLAELRETRIIFVEDPDIDSSFFRGIRWCGDLSILILHDTHISDDQVKEFGHFQLTQLYLSGTNVTNASVDMLSSIKSLQVLDIHNTKITESGKERLAEALPQCNVIYKHPSIEDIMKKMNKVLDSMPDEPAIDLIDD